VSIRIDSAVRRHSWVTLGPQLAQDSSLSDSPGSEEQTTRLQLQPAMGSSFSGHVNTLPLAEALIERATGSYIEDNSLGHADYDA
jgi:hypothetical protein